MLGAEPYLVLCQEIVQLRLGNGHGFDALQHGVDEFLHYGHGWPRHFVFLVYVDDRAIYEFREAERRLCR